MAQFQKGLWCCLLALSTWTLLAQQNDCADPLPDFDFSKAGYKNGSMPLPYHSQPATLLLGQGRFVVDSLIRLSDGDVLRGAGREKTVLFFPQGLKGLGAPCGHQGVDCFDWSNGVIRAEGKEIGIEDLTVEFPKHGWCHYCGEDNNGYNGISLFKCEDCWVKNVTVKNCDSGIFIEAGSSKVTVEDVSISVNQGIQSHLHIAISGRSTQILVKEFKVYGNTFHGLTANWGSSNSVFSNGWGDTLRIEPDHNCNGVGGSDSCCPNILFTNIRGRVSSMQTHDRANKPLQAIIWNVGEFTKCPEDVYYAQLRLREH